MDTALVHNGVVAQVWRDTASASLDAEAYVGTLVEFEPGQVVCGMAWDGDELGMPAPAAPTAEQLKTYAADKRYRVETGGVVFNGMPVWTDRATQSMLSRTVQLLDKGILVEPLRIKTPDAFLELTKAQIEAIGAAVAVHVQSAFDVECDVATAIDAETITTTAEIDSAAWPSNT